MVWPKIQFPQLVRFLFDRLIALRLKMALCAGVLFLVSIP